MRADDGNQPHSSEHRAPQKGFDLDTIKLALVVGLVALGVWGNSYFREESVLYRALALIAMAGLCGFIAYHTARGRSAWALMNEARTELRRVHFPTRRETTNTTGLVILVVIVIALILFLFDSLLSLIVEGLIG